MSSDLAAGIRRVKGVPKFGVRLGNWPKSEQSQMLWHAPEVEWLKGKRDRILLAVLLACGVRRHEAVDLDFDHIQQREEHRAVDDWVRAANLTSGKLFRRVHKSGKAWGEGLTEKAVWNVVREYARKAGIEKLAPHDLRRTWARLCHAADGELEQIQFLLGHV